MKYLEEADLIFEVRHMQLDDDMDYLKGLRQDIYKQLREWVTAPGAVGSLKMAFREVTENMWRHGRLSENEPGALIVRCYKGPIVEIITQNRVSTNSEHVARFRETIDVLADSSEREAAQHRREAAALDAGKIRRTGPGIGIFRVVDEAAVKVSGRISDGLVTVSAIIDPKYMWKVLREKAKAKEGLPVKQSDWEQKTEPA